MTQRAKNMVVLIFLLGIIALALPWFMAGGREDLVLDDVVRKKSGGEFARLSQGLTHFDLAGPEDGPLVVLVHGLTVPLFDWDAQVPALTRAGFRVLRYDHYGRGFSDRPQVEYDRNLYMDQLLELLDFLEVEEPVILVGHSFGGGLVAEFAAQNPEKVSKTALVAPVVHIADGNAGVKLVRVPVLGDYMARLILVPTLTKRANGLFDASKATKPGDLKKQFKEQTRYQGFEQAVVSQFRSNALESFEPAYKKLAQGKMPVLLVWGDKDGSVSAGDVENLRKWMPNCQYAHLSGVGHSPNLETPKKFNRILVEFLRGGPPVEP